MKLIRLVDIVIIFILLFFVPAYLGSVFGGASRSGSIVLCIFIWGIPLCIGYLGLRNKNLLLVINLIVSISLIISAGLFACFVNVYTQTISMFLILLFIALAVINLISIFVHWVEHGFGAFLPICISILTVILIVFSVRVGNHAKMHRFNKRLPQFENAVKMVESKLTDEHIRLTGEDIPQEYRHLAYFIIGDKRANGKLIVTFVWGGGFPVKHTAYAYTSDGSSPIRDSEFQKDWYHCKRINDNWFKVGD